jgi:hydrogenase maturation protein HypF
VSVPRRRIEVTGLVQGVGFRPHVYRLAVALGVAGWVANTGEGVLVEATGPAAALDDLARRVRADAPAAADVRGVRVTHLPDAADPAAGFAIRDAPGSAAGGGDGPRTTVPPDAGTCADCLRELADPADRRYRHPFITCTACGPRFTLVTGLPYDRPRTSMAPFPMCAACAREYRDPADRRFHAQPVACPDCGPRLWADDGAERTDGDEAALARALRVLADGGTVAVKGVGGYHLACRADLPAAVGTLRARKRRPDRPLALLVPSAAVARRLVRLDAAAEALLTGPVRPVVLAPRRGGAPVADAVAPGVGELGVLCAPTGLHQLLLTPAPGGGPVADVLVLTSANRSGEPLCHRDDLPLLRRLADLVLGHDREIVAPCDDSVLRVVDGELQPVRRSRGYAPLPVAVSRPAGGPTVLAVGAELKNAPCVLSGGEAVPAQHLGDMGGWAAQQALADATARLLALTGAEPARWAADAHPGYRTTAWARAAAPVPVVQVQHHRAHAAALLAEHGLLGEPCLVACFDGTGHGDDGAAWGGEWLRAGADLPAVGGRALTRVASLAEATMVGGDRAVAEPWRLALAHLRRAGVAWSDDLPCVAAVPDRDRALLGTALDRGVAAVPTTSVGRLFDAVAALLGVRQRITYEGQAAVELEALAARAASGDPAGWVGAPAVAGARGWVPAPAGPGDPREHLLDPAPALRALVAGLRAGSDRAALALGFHVWLARAVRVRADGERAARGTDLVGLTGGAFANVLLHRCCAALLRAGGHRVVRHRLVPCGDGGLGLGQAVLAAAERKG